MHMNYPILVVRKSNDWLKPSLPYDSLLVCGVGAQLWQLLPTYQGTNPSLNLNHSRSCRMTSSSRISLIWQHQIICAAHQQTVLSITSLNSCCINWSSSDISPAAPRMSGSLNLNSNYRLTRLLVLAVLLFPSKQLSRDDTQPYKCHDDHCNGACG
jgi:hypothetical protein